MATTFIYALCEPGTRTVRYIGKTRDLKKRFYEHLKISSRQKTHLGNWLRKLKACGKTPKMLELCKVPAKEGALEEIRLISSARAGGLKLVNGTDGGEGCFNPTPETRAKKSAAQTGVRNHFFGKRLTLEHRAAIGAGVKEGLTPERRKKISAAGIGRIFSPEHRAAIGAARRGKKHSPEARAKISAAKRGKSVGLGRKFSEEHRANISAAMTGKPWSTVRRTAWKKKTSGGSRV